MFPFGRELYIVKILPRARGDNIIVYIIAIGAPRHPTCGDRGDWKSARWDQTDESVIFRIPRLIHTVTGGEEF